MRASKGRCERLRAASVTAVRDPKRTRQTTTLNGRQLPALAPRARYSQGRKRPPRRRVTSPDVRGPAVVRSSTRSPLSGDAMPCRIAVSATFKTLENNSTLLKGFADLPCVALPDFVPLCFPTMTVSMAINDRHSSSTRLRTSARSVQSRAPTAVARLLANLLRCRPIQGNCPRHPRRRSYVLSSDM
jgi:hypothetical protein